MVSHLKRLASPPIFGGDDEKTYAAGLLNTILYSILLGIFIYAIAAPIDPEEPLIRIFYIGAFAGLVTTLLYMMRRGHIRFASWAIVVGIWALLTTVCVTRGGVQNPAFGGYVVAILCAGLLLSHRAGIGWALLCVAGGGAMVFAEAVGLLSAPPVPYTPRTIWLAQTAYFFVAAVLVGLALRSITQALGRARREIVERQLAEKALRRQNEYLAALHETALFLLNRLDLNTLLESVVVRAAELVDTPHGFIDMVLPDGSALEARFGSGVYHEFIGRRIRPGEGVSGRVWAGGQALMVNDYQTWPGHSPIFAQIGLRALMGVPLKSSGKVVGILGFAQLEPDKPFSAEQMELMSHFAELASIALDNAQLYEIAQNELGERIRAEVALREAEFKYRMVVEQVPAITYVDAVDKGGLTTFISPQVQTMLGVAPADWMEGKLALWLSLIEPADRQRTHTAFEQLIETGRPFDMEYRVNTPDGRSVWIRDQAVLLRDAVGQPLSIHGVMFDITERKHIEEALRLSQERFRVVLDHLGEGVCVQDSDWRYTYANPAAHAILGWPPGSLIGKSEDNILNPSGVVVVKRENNRRLAGEITSYEVDIQRPDGGGRTIWTTGVPRLDERGNLLETFVAFTDITERRRAEEDLRRSEELYRRAIEAAGAVPYQLEYGQEAYSFIGAGIETLIGLKPEAMKSTIWDAIVQEAIPLGESAALTQQTAVRRAREGQTVVWKADYRILAGDGQIKWLTDSAVQVLNDEGTPRGSIGILQDVTDRKQAVEAAQRLNTELEGRVAERTAELEAAVQELESFSYSVSHDLRAPLRAINGFARILLAEYRGQIPPNAQHYLERVQEGAQRMGQLIDDLLKLSRVTRQAMTYATVDLSAAARAILAELQRNSPDRAVEWVVGESLVARGDPGLLHIMLDNFLSNAWKYSARRDHTRIEFGRANQSNNIPAFFVRDNGVGFDMTYAHKLFGAFQRLHSTAEFEGTGIGLATVHRIVQRHGGQVWAEAEVDKGATFYFTLGGE